MVKKSYFKKKLMSVLLCSTMLFSLVGCSGDSEKEADKETTASTEAPSKTEKETEAETEGTLKVDGVLNLALNVMYNDADGAYYGNETGPVIEVTEDGQYTLTFDCATNLSGAATGAGIRGLNNLTAIYIKDYAVTAGELGASNITSCDIKYDKIVVDGVELTITNSEAKSGIKSSGIFDTNDPLNAWDGSAVSETIVDTENHVLNIDGIENPQKIEVTFTLSNLVFAE